MAQTKESRRPITWYEETEELSDLLGPGVILNHFQNAPDTFPFREVLRVITETMEKHSSIVEKAVRDVDKIIQEVRENKLLQWRKELEDNFDPPRIRLMISKVLIGEKGVAKVRVARANKDTYPGYGKKRRDIHPNHKRQLKEIWESAVRAINQKLQDANLLAAEKGDQEKVEVLDTESGLKAYKTEGSKYRFTYACPY